MKKRKRTFLTIKKAKLKYRFFQKIQKCDDGHWLWLGATIHGYGMLWRDGKNNYAHRVSYELHNGPIAPGMCVCHTCDIPSCVNPEHLFLGTQKDNMIDCKNKGRRKKLWLKRRLLAVGNNVTAMTVIKDHGVT